MRLPARLNMPGKIPRKIDEIIDLLASLQPAQSADLLTSRSTQGTTRTPNLTREALRNPQKGNQARWA